MISYIIYDLTYMQNLKKKEGGVAYRYRKQNSDCQTQGLRGVGKKSEGSQREKIPVVR